MKPPPLRYSRPTSLAEALAVLASLGPDGKVLAGGQSLLPLLTMRLAAPDHLVDINRLADLAYVRVDDGQVRVGALARHARCSRTSRRARAQPLLAQALRFVAHPTIRNRGTTVGSIVHADPAGEMPAVLALLGGDGPGGQPGRANAVIPASDFFLGPLESGGADRTSWPPRSASRCCRARRAPRFAEVSRRHGDYAVCGVAALVQLGDDGRIAAARAAYLSVGPSPLVIDLTEAVTGAPAGGRRLRRRRRAGTPHVDPEPDIHATAAYRRHLAGVLTERALADAAGEARRTENAHERAVRNCTRSG